VATFDEMSLVYDNAIDWEARLLHEMPFLLESIPDVPNPRVLDMACGSGHHATALASYGCRVVGIDVSQAMLDVAQELAQKECLTPEFKLGDITKLEEVVEGKFDLIICLGNSLALLPSLDAVSSVFESVGALLRPEGLFVFQVLNFEGMVKNEISVLPEKTGILPSGEEVSFKRVFEHHLEKGYSDLSFTTQMLDSTLTPYTTTQRVLHINEELVLKETKNLGFNYLQIFSDYRESLFQSAKDRNLIVRTGP
jgi:2-polyprenyl-3-methyl-5-hydroxy-6-metoxy-1,4-benzoquinol methylase